MVKGNKSLLKVFLSNARRPRACVGFKNLSGWIGKKLDAAGQQHFPEVHELSRNCAPARHVIPNGSRVLIKSVENEKRPPALLRGQFVYLGIEVIMPELNELYLELPGPTPESRRCMARTQLSLLCSGVRIAGPPRLVFPATYQDQNDAPVRGKSHVYTYC